MREDDCLSVGCHLPTVVFWQVGHHHRLAAVGYRCPHELAVAVVGHALHEQVVAAWVELHVLGAHAQHLASAHFPQSPRPRHLAAIVGVVSAGYGIATVGREFKSPIALAHEHVIDAIEPLRAGLEYGQRGIVVGGDCDFRLYSATQKGAHLHMVVAWLKGQVAVALIAVHVNFAGFQACHGYLGLDVHGRLHVEREGCQRQCRPRLQLLSRGECQRARLAQWTAQESVVAECLAINAYAVEHKRAAQRHGAIETETSHYMVAS